VENDIVSYTGSGLASGFKNRMRALESAGKALGYASPSAARAGLSPRTAVLTLLAGAGTRWRSSLVRTPGGAPVFPQDAPRGLYPVRNLFGAKPERIPIACYALAAGGGLGRRVLVTRGFEDAIRKDALPFSGDDPDGFRFRTQEAIAGKPRGHGDAAFQAMSEWEDREFVVVNFGGDASNPFTALAALVALAALSKLGEGVDLVLPVARVKAPAYPVRVDANGLPLSFGHAKLSGGDVAVQDEYAYTNVGVRVYRAKALAAACGEARLRWFEEGRGYSIPGNDPDGGEFALDNVDRWLAGRGAARLLAVARPEELSPVKTLDDVPAFERAMSLVARDYDLVRR